MGHGRIDGGGSSWQQSPHTSDVCGIDVEGLAGPAMDFDKNVRTVSGTMKMGFSVQVTCDAEGLSGKNENVVGS